MNVLLNAFIEFSKAKRQVKMHGGSKWGRFAYTKRYRNPEELKDIIFELRDIIISNIERPYDEASAKKEV